MADHNRVPNEELLRLSLTARVGREPTVEEAKAWAVVVEAKYLERKGHEVPAFMQQYVVEHPVPRAVPYAYDAPAATGQQVEQAPRSAAREHLGAIVREMNARDRAARQEPRIQELVDRMPTPLRERVAILRTPADVERLVDRLPAREQGARHRPEAEQVPSRFRVAPGLPSWAREVIAQHRGREAAGREPGHGWESQDHGIER